MEQDQIVTELRDIRDLMESNQASNREHHEALTADIHSIRLEMSKYKGLLGGILFSFAALWTFATFVIKTTLS